MMLLNYYYFLVMKSLVFLEGATEILGGISTPSPMARSKKKKKGNFGHAVFKRFAIPAI